MGDRNTTFYHHSVSKRNASNHIHYLKDENDNFFGATLEIKAHAVEYFQNVLGDSDLPISPISKESLQELVPFRCSSLQQDYLKRAVLTAEIKGTVFSMPLNKSPGPDGYSVEFLRASWETL